jgi:hypothetical protein
MTLLQVATKLNEQGFDLALAFTIVGGLWTLVKFYSDYLENKRKTKLEYFKTIRDYNLQLRNWANQIIDLMTSAGHLCLLDPKQDSDFYTKRHNLLIDLSSWADKGRFFLPNSDVDNFGHQKPSAYRGFRSESLNLIVSCYDLVKSMDYIDKTKNLELKTKIMDTKRLFVSTIQEELDPRKFEIEFIGHIKREI